MKRADDYLERSAHLKGLDDAALHARFWELVDQLTQPLLAAGREYTSPAIERSVLLRMGFSSLEAKAITDFCLDHGLMPHGCGHVIYKLSKTQGLPIREAGLGLISGSLREAALALFQEVAK
ncbi:MAG: ornithine aminomutase subunit alpha [Christensenellales bacterium]